MITVQSQFTNSMECFAGHNGYSRIKVAFQADRNMALCSIAHVGETGILEILHVSRFLEQSNGPSGNEGFRLE